MTQGHHSDFVRAREPDRSAETGGEIVTVDGKVVGEHHGYEAFTVGQRKGLGVAMGKPYFVVRIEPESRQVVIGPKESLEQDGLIADEANWLIDPTDVPAMFRSRSATTVCQSGHDFDRFGRFRSVPSLL